MKCLSVCRRWIVLLTAALSALGVLAAERVPNIVIIFCDDLGYADVGGFGGKVPTPNIDRLAKEGRKFTNFHVAQAVCSASRAALLTGCYPNRIGIHGALGPKARVGIAESELTLAEMLKRRGYATGMAGKWHLGHMPQFLPTRHGFDEFFGIPYSNDMWPHHPEAKAGTYPSLPLIEGDKIKDDDVTPEEQAQLTTQFTERAVKFIDRHKAKPFFFYLAHPQPHVPLFVSEKSKGKSNAGLHGDVIMELDWSVGQVLEALDRNKLDKDTLIIFTSDNGPWLSYGNHAGSSGPFREGKGTSWEGGIRVPCVMRWPGKIPAGTESAQMMMTIDLFPTIAFIAGGELPAHPIDGRSVLGLLEGRPGAQNPHEGYGIWYEQGQLQAVISGDGRWKLIFPHTYRTLPNGGGTNGIPGKYAQVKIEQPELYDLANDPGEKKNVAGQNAEIVARLRAVSEKLRAEVGDSLTKRNGSGIRAVGRAM